MKRKEKNIGRSDCVNVHHEKQISKPSNGARTLFGGFLVTVSLLLLHALKGNSWM